MAKLPHRNCRICGTNRIEGLILVICLPCGKEEDDCDCISAGNGRTDQVKK